MLSDNVEVAMLTGSRVRYTASMMRKIRIVPGFATPNEVAKELGVSKTELKTIDDLLNKPMLGIASPQNRSGRFVVRKAAPKLKGTARHSASKTLWQVVKATKKRPRSSVD